MRTKITKLYAIGVTPSIVRLRIHKTKQHKKVLGFKCLLQGVELVDGLPEVKCQQIVLRNYLTFFYYTINV